jgi:cardiolipin synthase
VTDGERWSRDLLAELRDGRFSPASWRRFLARSLVRAREQGHVRPRARRQAFFVGAVGLAGWAAVAAAGRPAAATAGAGWWLLVILMLYAHLGMLETPGGRPVDRIGLPNLLTLCRAAVVPALPALPPVALAATILLAAGTDVLDGVVARARGEATRLGRWLDGTVDGVLLAAAAAALAGTGMLPWWSGGLVVARVAFPWLSAPFWLARAKIPDAAVYVSGRLPGAFVWAGLVAAALAVPGAAETAAAGALGGMATFALTLVATGRPCDHRPMEIGVPEPDREIEIVPLEEPVPATAPVEEPVPSQDPVPA